MVKVHALNRRTTALSLPSLFKVASEGLGSSKQFSFFYFLPFSKFLSQNPRSMYNVFYITCKKFRTLKFRTFNFRTLFPSFRTKISDTALKHA